MFLAIDLGTSFIKGAVLDLAAYQVSHAYRIPFPDPIPGMPSVYREYNPEHVIAAVRSVLNVLLPFAENCEGLVMCSQMHSLIFCEADGRARSNLINWEDERGLLPHPSGNGSYFDWVKARLDTNDIRQLGNELRPGLPIVFLAWCAEQMPGVETGSFAAALPDFILANLCEQPPVTELTHAESHGLLNLDTQGWHRAALNKLRLEKFRLPEIRPQGAVVGYLPVGGRSIPCYTPVGDYQCALVGALLKQGELSLNISTGSQISLLTKTPVFGNFQTRPYFDQHFTSAITNIPAGRALNSLVALLSELAVGQQVQLPDSWAYISQAAEAVETTTMQVDLAFFSSSVGDRGAITNIQESEITVGHLFRAAFQNMANNYYICALRLSPEQAWNSLVFSGGLAQKIGLLRRLISEKFQKPHRMSPHPEDTLFGLLVLATAFTQRADNVDHASTNIYAALTNTP